MHCKIPRVEFSDQVEKGISEVFSDHNQAAWADFPPLDPQDVIDNADQHFNISPLQSGDDQSDQGPYAFLNHLGMSDQFLSTQGFASTEGLPSMGSIYNQGITQQDDGSFSFSLDNTDHWSATNDLTGKQESLNYITDESVWNIYEFKYQADENSWQATGRYFDFNTYEEGQLPDDQYNWPDRKSVV